MRVIKETNWVLLLLLIMVGSFAAMAQHPCYLKLNRQNGLPSDAVYNVFQDSKGFIWVATGEGLSRYDGFEFVPYKSDAQTSLPGSCIKEDKFGRIWYENFDGYLYYTDSGKLKPVAQGTPFYYMPYGITSRHLFVTTKNGVDVYDIGTLKRVKTIVISYINWLRSAGSDNSYYVLADDLLYKIDDDLTMRSAAIPAGQPGIVRDIYIGDSCVYITSVANKEKVLYLFNKSFEREPSLSIPHPQMVQSGAYIDGQIYLNTPAGSFVYNHSFPDNKEVVTYFKGKSISGVIKDRQNNFWFSTTNEGVYIVPDMNNRIYATSGYSPTRITASANEYYAGTQTGTLLHISHGFDSVEVVSHSPGGSSIYYVYADSENVVYSSTGFTIRPLKGSGKEQTYALPVKQIARLDDKYYAFASSVHCGLLHNPVSKSDAPSVWDKAFSRTGKTSIPGIAVLVEIVRAKSVAYDAAAHLVFFATNKGIFVVSPDTVTTLTINGRPVFASALEVANGHLFALTAVGVVLKLPYGNRKNNDSGHSTIPLKGITQMKLFGSELYLLGGSSLHRLNTTTGAMKRLNSNIDIHSINDMLKYNDKLFVATHEGIIVLTDDAAETGRKPPLFYLNSITANNTTFTPAQTVNLRYNENNISIKFSVLDFGTTQPAQVYYRLNDEGWKEIPRESRVLHFPSLSSGSYALSFRVGQDTANIYAINFNIQPAFWKQWWFYLICLLAVVAIVLWYYKRQISTRVKKLEAQKLKMQLEQELGKSMLTSIRAQMNPHFFYNALNTIQAYIFTNDKAKASNYLAKFSRLTRTILEMSEAETVSLSEEAETMKLYLELEKMRFDSGFEYDMQFKGIDNKEMIEMPSMIIQPYVENAIKHGLLHKQGEKLLTVIFEKKGTELIVIIDDNGIGRQRSEELNKIRSEKYRSFSTKASEKRMELLNKGKSEKIVAEITDKVLSNGKAAGTLVLLRIPI